MNSQTMQPDVRVSVDRLLLEQGRYAPLELLLQTGLLRYSDYDAWRCGQAGVLENRLQQSPESVRTLLEQAAHYSRALGLVPETRDQLPWKADEGNKALRYCTDNEGQRLYCVQYIPCPNTSQTDLFLDNPDTVLINGLVRALASRDHTEASRLLDRLHNQQPDHPRQASLQLLFDTHSRSEAEVNDCGGELEFLLNTIKPLASELLGAYARDYLVPLWQRLANALADASFDPEHPHLHLSFLATQMYDWQGVCDAVEREDDWPAHPVLHVRRATALEHLRSQEAALAAWFRICWTFPVEAAHALDENGLLGASWQDFRALDPILEPELYPAWRVLTQPDLIQKLSGPLHPPSTQAGKSFILVKKLLNQAITHVETADAEMIRLRSALKATHEPLFMHYMRLQR